MPIWNTVPEDVVSLF